MAAFTRLPSGVVVRWHAGPDFTECRNADCGEHHVTIAELGDFGEATR